METRCPLCDSGGGRQVEGKGMGGVVQVILTETCKGTGLVTWFHIELVIQMVKSSVSTLM